MVKSGSGNGGRKETGGGLTVDRGLIATTTRFVDVEQNAQCSCLAVRGHDGQGFTFTTFELGEEVFSGADGNVIP